MIRVPSANRRPYLIQQPIINIYNQSIRNNKFTNGPQIMRFYTPTASKPSSSSRTETPQKFIQSKIIYRQQNLLNPYINAPKPLSQINHFNSAAQLRFSPLSRTQQVSTVNDIYTQPNKYHLKNPNGYNKTSKNWTQLRESTIQSEITSFEKPKSILKSNHQNGRPSIIPFCSSRGIFNDGIKTKNEDKTTPLISPKQTQKQTPKSTIDPQSRQSQQNLLTLQGQVSLVNLKANQLKEGFDYSDMRQLKKFWIKYVGGERGGKMDGRGSMTLSNGERFEGTFKDGVVHGEGIFLTIDNVFIEGIWENGLLLP